MRLPKVVRRAAAIIPRPVFQCDFTIVDSGLIHTDSVNIFTHTGAANHILRNIHACHFRTKPDCLGIRGPLPSDATHLSQM